MFTVRIFFTSSYQWMMFALQKLDFFLCVACLSYMSISKECARLATRQGNLNASGKVFLLKTEYNFK